MTPMRGSIGRLVPGASPSPGRSSVRVAVTYISESESVKITGMVEL
jgi:hypothetical protein